MHRYMCVWLIIAVCVFPVSANAVVSVDERVCETICAGARVNDVGVKEITYAQFQDMRASGEAIVVIDALSPERYAAGHIPDAVSMPAAPVSADVIAAIVPDVSTPVVVYCANFSCHASTRAAQALMSLGYETVVDYKGGIKEWQEMGNELST